MLRSVARAFELGSLLSEHYCLLGQGFSYVVLSCAVESLVSVVLAWVLVFNILLSGGLCTLALLCCRVIPDAEPALTLTLVLFFGVMSSFICSSFSRLPPLGTSTP